MRVEHDHVGRPVARAARARARRWPASIMSKPRSRSAMRRQQQVDLVVVDEQNLAAAPAARRRRDGRAGVIGVERSGTSEQSRPRRRAAAPSASSQSPERRRAAPALGRRARGARCRAHACATGASAPTLADDDFRVCAALASAAIVTAASVGRQLRQLALQRAIRRPSARARARRGGRRDRARAGAQSPRRRASPALRQKAAAGGASDAAGGRSSAEGPGGAGGATAQRADAIARMRHAGMTCIKPAKSAAVAASNACMAGTMRSTRRCGRSHLRWSFGAAAPDLSKARADPLPTMSGMRRVCERAADPLAGVWSASLALLGGCADGHAGEPRAGP
ncbi:MAG: hypothetical protein MZW92_00150 [Comamonadaceae bacterium]|nr:hypothetical protein [Comamonadaceae bacterium]